MKRVEGLVLSLSVLWVLGCSAQYDPQRIYTLAGHEASVQSVALSPDGRTLASGARDGTIRLWASATGTLLHTMELSLREYMSYPTGVFSVAFSPDGKLLASGSSDLLVRLWDPATGALVRTLTSNASPSRDYPNCVNSVAFSPDGETLASATDDVVELWDPNTGALVRTLTHHAHDVYTVAFSPDGATLASGSSDGTIELWGLATEALSRTLPAHTAVVSELVFSPDGQALASASSGEVHSLKDTVVKLWSPSTGVLLRTLVHAGIVACIAFSPDGRTLASGTYNDTVGIWDATTGALMGVFTGDGYTITSVSFSPDGTALATGDSDGTIILWDLKAFLPPNKPPRATISATASLIRAGQAVSFDGSASTDSDGHIVSFAWTFGDGGTSGSANPTHAYATAGTFGVTLTVQDDDGATATTSTTVSVTPANAAPIASFTWQALSSSGARLLVEPRTGDRIRFDASSSSDPDGRIVSYEWDWESDGTYDTKETSPTIEHTFSTSGSHRVTLRVTDDQGATGSVTQTVSVGERQAPRALFAFSPTPPSVLDSVHFSDQSSDADGQIVSWKWEFGDGTTSTDRNPTHTYTRKGTFTVKLTVTDNDGLTGTKSQALTVVNLAPEASFTFGPVQPSTGQSVRFDGSPSTDRDGTISSYAWDFNGDGKTDASGMDATWTFVEAKTYTVTLSVVDSDGATGTAEQDVVVSAAPSGPPRFQQQWGLVIGIGSYEDHGISDLAYTEADAQAFYDFLTSTQGGGLQRDHVRFLLNEQATTASVKAAFRWLIGQAGAEDLVVIYFAGHGGTGEDVTVPPDEADGVDEYLITYDAQKTDLFSTAVRDDEMADWLASFRCDNVVVILDSCFAAGATRSLEQTGTRAGPGNRVFNDLVGPGRLFLAASQEAEFSYEDAALGHGVFTYYLLRGLGAMEGETAPEADADHDGRVTVEELRIYLEREVTKAQPKQHPLVTGDLTLERVALDGYGVPLAGEVTTIQGDYVIISLGSRHGIQVGNRFEIVRPYSLPDGSTAAEVRALVQVAAILEPDRAACVLVESHFPVEIGDSVRPAQ